MKKLASAILAAAMLLSLSAQMAFASTDSGPWSNGESFQVYDFEDKDGNLVGDDGYTNEDYSLSFSSSSRGKKYVTWYIDDDSNAVYIKVKPGATITETTNVTGKMTIIDKQARERYTATVDFTLKPAPDIPIVETDYREFELGGYFMGKTRFRTTDKESIGTLYARFESEKTSDTVAYFQVKIVDQPSLFLGHNEDVLVDVMRKYPDANMRFLTWDATPKFDMTGTLGIIMERDEYLYKRSSDNVLTQVSGTYNEDRGTFDFKTDTLGAYVISDVKLSGAAAAAPSSSSVAAVAPPASSSKPAASSVAPAPPASSSVAPPPASSITPAPSSSTSSEPASSESSEPASSEASSEPTPEVSQPEPPASSSVATEPEEQEGGFPVVPVAVGAGVVVLGGLVAFFVLRGRGGSKKHFDSWDD